MSSLQKAGGTSALIAAASWVMGFVVFIGVLAPAGYFDPESGAAQRAAVLVDKQAIASLSYLIPYVVWGAFHVVVVLALHERLKAGAPAITQIAAAFGLIFAGVAIASGMIGIVGIGTVAELYGTDPAMAGSAWLMIESVVLGLTKNEILSGSWLLLTGWAGLQAGELPRSLSYFGVILGGAGILTLVPILEVLGAIEVLGIVFGLGLIVWYAWLGVIMLRHGARHGMGDAVRRSGIGA